MIIRQIPIQTYKEVFESDDGIQFDTKEKCIKYENEELYKNEKSCDNCHYFKNYTGEFSCWHTDGYMCKENNFRAHDWIGAGKYYNFPK